ncbi:7221_t:CDS:2 [Entrophospora sp. SA101]|nr:7221_t:CDS:2 [Entrophospora sp. SA101]
MVKYKLKIEALIAVRKKHEFYDLSGSGGSNNNKHIYYNNNRQADDNAIENDDDFEDNDKTLIVKKIRFKNSDIDDIYAARILKTKGGEVPGEELGKFMKEIEILKMLDGEQLMRLANEDIDDESLVILQDINNINSGLDVAAVTASCKVKSKYIIITFNYNNNICTIAIGIRIDVKGETVFCYHGPTYYPAQILDTKINYIGGTVGPQYFIHYKGWNKKWDEWVPEDRIFEMTQERINDLNNNNNMMARNRTISTESSSSSPAPKGFSIDQDLTDDERSKPNNYKNGLPIEIIQFNGKFLTRTTKHKIQINISDERMVKLADEWQWITKNQMLVIPLPCGKTVNHILDEFLEYKMEKFGGNKSPGSNLKRTTQECELMETIDGIKIYFNEVLPISLLYRFERQQYVELVDRYPDHQPASIYGAEHLMRLIVKLPALVSKVQMKEEKAQQIQEVFQELYW